MVFGDSVLHNLVMARPNTLSELHTVSGIGPEKADRYGADIIAICHSETPPTISPTPSKRNRHLDRRASAELRDPRILLLAEPMKFIPKPSPALVLPASEPAEALTSEQQALDQRLREWRQSESEKLNLPLFFVLASTTLRSIVLTRPQTLSQLKTIPGLGHEKIEKFGASILEICTT